MGKFRNSYDVDEKSDSINLNKYKKHGINGYSTLIKSFSYRTVIA